MSASQLVKNELLKNELPNNHSSQSNSKQNNLTLIVEEKFLALIEKQEKDLNSQNIDLSVENYIRLANLYHFHKNFEKEEKILARFANSPRASNDDLVEVYDRMEKVASLRYVQEKVSFSEINHSSNLQLVNTEEEPHVVELSSQKKLTSVKRNENKTLIGQSITALAVCAVYTGKTEDDELLQLALVLFEYQAGSEYPFKILANYTGNRLPKKPVADEIYNRFRIRPSDLKHNRLDEKKIVSLFEKADFVISHNNSDVERRQICLLYPELRQSKWYSTQKDIPWRALGFESKSLSELSIAVGKPKPRTSSERALAICLLLQQEEPYAEYPFMERIYYMRPMKDLVWTRQMQSRHKKLTRKVSVGLMVSVGLFVVAGTMLGLYFNGFF